MRVRVLHTDAHKFMPYHVCCPCPYWREIDVDICLMMALGKNYITYMHLVSVVHDDYTCIVV